MPELLLEVGTEELPASFVRKAYTDLRDHLARLLDEAGVLQGEGIALGTPRRMIVCFADLKDRQEDRTIEQRGPSMRAAYADGNPTPALLGFCRGQGVEPGELRNDGQYVWVTKQVPGQPTSELLAEIIPKAIRSLTFDKTMRWGTARMRFARPIRWILASFDGHAVPFQIESVTSGLESRGHRFYSPEPFQASTLAALMQGLRDRKVEPDPQVRRQAIVDQSPRVAGGEPQMSDALIDENVFLTEWPTAVSGEFREEFQYLPEPVLVTAMAKHEKMFPVRDSAGKLINRFVFIRNSGQDESVRQGNEWVLNARFNDAKFFYDEDQKHTLADFLEKTSGILFQEKLGTVRQRADRLSALAKSIAEMTGASAEEIAFAEQAGLFAKADLSTGLVSELASLQGIIGGEYAKREGMPAEVCRAVASQYDPEGATDATSMRLIMADQIDKLAGYLGVGLIPTGSSDPFGLRRACTQLIELAWKWPGKLPAYEEMLNVAIKQYEARGVNLDESGAFRAFWDLMAARYEALLPDARYDLLDAALRTRTGANVSAPRAVRMRVLCLERLASDVPFVQTATRPINIVAAARKKGIEFGEQLEDVVVQDLEAADGEALYTRSLEIAGLLQAAEAAEDDSEVTRLILTLAEPINQFFETTMVMAEDERVRRARLTLLEVVSQQLLTAGDWSKLVIEG